MKEIKKLLILLSGLLLLCSCGGGSGAVDRDVPTLPPVPENGKINIDDARLKPGLSCSSYKSYLVESFTEQYLDPTRYCGGCEFFISPAVVDSGSSPTTVSDTNIQEVGVGEADIIKADSDGNLFVADRKRVHIIDGFAPQDMSVLTTLSFSESVKDLVLDEARQRLIVLFYSRYSNPFAPSATLSDAPSTAPGPQPGVNEEFETNTIIKFFNIEDLSNPVEINQFRHSGYLHTERYIGGSLLLLTWDYVNDYVAYDSEFFELVRQYEAAVNADDSVLAAQLRQQVKEAVAERINTRPIESLLPKVFEASDDGSVSAQPALSCEDIYAPNVRVEPNIVTVFRLDADGELVDTIGALTTVTDAYVSPGSIFLYQGSNNWWWSPLQESETAIHQISIGDAAMEYKGVGIIPGNVRNRFSLGEHDGYLRVASTETTFVNDNRRLINHLHVLGEGQNGTLPIVGKTGTYAEDETIFSARFIGDRGFVVTFREVDPLFAFDLSDPSSPAIVGELKIPGFSEYIHPVSEDRLLTVGRNGNDDGLLPGVQMQLFDVSVLTDPVLLHSYVPLSSTGDLDFSWTASSYDPRAFSYFPAEKMLTIPLRIVNSGNAGDFSGFISMSVSDADGFTEIGRIDHDFYLAPVVCIQAPCPSSDYNYSNPTRTVVMQDEAGTYLYTLSDIGIVAHSINDLSTALGVINFSGILPPLVD